MTDALETAVRRVGNEIIIESLPKKMTGKTVSQTGLINAATEATSATVGGLGYLAPVGAVGAAAAGGTVALMASRRCPRSRPCRVRIDIMG